MTMNSRSVLVALAMVAAAAQAGPMPLSSVPDPLKTWVPWVLHGQPSPQCPIASEPESGVACAWPSRLDLTPGATGARFTFDVTVFGGGDSAVELPGDGDLWPQQVRADGRPIAVVLVGDRPSVRLPPGRHLIDGTLAWDRMPPDLRVPKAVGITTLVIDGATVGRAPDDESRVWLKRPVDADRSADALTARTTRLVDDDVPMRVVTQVELAIAGKPRDIPLDHALLPGFVAESLESALPARLQADGRLVVRGRPGNWRLSLTGRSPAPVRMLELPADSSGPEYWSFRAHNDLRLVSIAGAQTVDPKQVAIAPDWRSLPAYRLKPGDRLTLVETRRGDPEPAPDRLAIEREIRLDFDGGGYSVRDRISGQLSRSSRIEMADPGVLGRVTVDGADQPVTRLAAGGAVGVELRGEQLNLGADSRIPGGGRTMAATGWRSDFRQASVQLTLPPGWRLLHVFGVDLATGSWVSAWTLWDFFFVLVSALAAGRLAGWRRGVLFGAALALGWHMPGAPQALWPVLLAVIALARVLPPGQLRFWADWARRGVIAAIALLLLPYAVQQFRLAMYPSLERPDATPGLSIADAVPVLSLPQSQGRAAAPVAAAPPMAATAERAIPAGASPTVGAAPDELRASAGILTPAAKQKAQPAATARDDIDPSARVGTGAGVPSWSWWRHSLEWQGPVPATQTMTLVLLPPAGTVVLRIGGLMLMLAALATVAAGSGGPGGDGGSRPAWPGLAWRWRRKAGAGIVLPLIAIAVLAASPDLSRAAPPPSADATSPPTAWPGPALLDALRERLTAPPDCAPRCAEVARLWITANASRVQLRLEVHAQAAVSVPLPGHGASWRPTEVMLDGRPAPLRRGEGDALWIAVPAGVSQVLLAGDVGGASVVEIVLPLPIRTVEAQIPGWTLSGQDASGRATGALSLAREQAIARTDDGATLRDALPPFVRVERQFRIGLRWTATTRIVRVSPSRAPLRVSVLLLTGEAVNDDRIVVKDGVASLQLGAEDEAEFASTLNESARIDLVAGTQPNQVEVWTVAVSPQWHASPTGIAPVLAPSGRRGLPQWQPWPSEKLSVALSRPIGVEGQTLTVDGLVTTVSPGQRATDAAAELTLRASQGGDHRLQLPDGAELLAAQVDGEQLPLLAPGGVLTVPITPGTHRLRVEWRVAQGMPWLMQPAGLRVGATGVDDRTQIDVPADRVVLAVGGPAIGPAVLFWGVLIVLAGVAVALARAAIAPLRVGAWFLLGVGIAQTSLFGAAAVVAWFFLFAARRRFGERLHATDGGRWFKSGQLFLLLWTLVAAGVLLDAVRTGLLGVPDLLIQGNGSDAAHLRWYADRFDNAAAPVWVVSIPVLAYRGLMLLWALWMAASVLNWVRWGWDAFSGGGYWHRGPTPGEPVTPGEPGSAAAEPAPQAAGGADPTDAGAGTDLDGRR